MHRLFFLISTICLALVAAPPVEAKPRAAKQAAAKKKQPNTVIKVVDLAKAKAKAVKGVEKAVKKVKGVTMVVVAKKKNEVKIWHKPEVKKADLEGAVRGAGFKLEGDAEPEEDDTGGEEYEEYEE